MVKQDRGANRDGGDATHLHFKSRLQAWEGEALIFDHATGQKVLRNFV